MAATHCAYDVMKLPSIYGVLTVRCDLKDAAWCMGQVVKTAAATDPGDWEVAGGEDSLSRVRPVAKKARTSPDPVAGSSTSSDSYPGRSKKLQEDGAKVKKVPFQDGNEGRTISIGANLTAK